MNHSPPTVSIVTATRERPHLLRQALHSIKSQTFESFEVLVVDDGSGPDVHEQYREMWRGLDDRFHLLLASPAGGPGSGPGKGRNYGIRRARGEFVAFLDHDDFWVRPDHLSVGVGALAGQGADYYFTHVRFEPEHPDLMWVAPPGALNGSSLVAADPAVRRVPLSLFLRVMRKYHIHPSHSIVRREVLEKAGGLIEGLRTADDVNLMLRVADQARAILYRSDPAVAIRLPEGKSFSLASSEVDQTLACYHAMLDIRARCRNPAVRRCARAREGWVFREMSERMAPRSRWEAFVLARQALATYPTLGAGWFLAKALFQTLAPNGPLPPPGSG